MQAEKKQQKEREEKDREARRKVRPTCWVDTHRTSGAESADAANGVCLIRPRAMRRSRSGGGARRRRQMRRRIIRRCWRRPSRTRPPPGTTGAAALAGTRRWVLDHLDSPQELCLGHPFVLLNQKQRTRPCCHPMLHTLPVSMDAACVGMTLWSEDHDSLAGPTPL